MEDLADGLIRMEEIPFDQVSVEQVINRLEIGQRAFDTPV